MPLPRKANAKRLTAELQRFEIEDPQFETPAVVYLRPLLDIEMDRAEEEVSEFVAQYIEGGFVHPTTEQWTKEPMPLLVGGEPVEITEPTVRLMHRYVAMQTPMIGKRPDDATFVTVADMIEATVKFDTFWRGLQKCASQVWRDGATGKAWGLTPADSDKQPNA